MKFVILTALVVSTTPLFAQEAPRDSRTVHSQSLRTIATIVERKHISRPKIDNNVGRRWFDLVINDLDPWRIYFTQKDIRRFQQHRDALDEQARRGDLSFADLVRETYSTRLREATSEGLSLLRQQHDFTIDEEFELYPASFPENRKSQSERRRKYVKYQMLFERLQGRSFAQSTESLADRYRRIAQDKSFQDDNEWYEFYLNAFARSVDLNDEYYGERTLVHWRIF